MSIYTRVRAETLAAYSGRKNFIAPAAVTPKQWCRIMEDVQNDDFSAESVLTVIESVCGLDAALLSIFPARESGDIVCYINGDSELIGVLYTEFANGAAMCDFAKIVNNNLELRWKI